LALPVRAGRAGSEDAWTRAHLSSWRAHPSWPLPALSLCVSCAEHPSGESREGRGNGVAASSVCRVLPRRAADHHVHHRTFVYNYGHTMMWWDWLAGTYKQPESVRQFNTDAEAKVQGGSNYSPAPRSGEAAEPVPLSKEE
jgi:hypothetical protein